MKVCIQKNRYPRRMAWCGRPLNLDKAYEAIALVENHRTVCLKCLSKSQTQLQKVRDFKLNQKRGRPANEY